MDETVEKIENQLGMAEELFITMVMISDDSHLFGQKNPYSC